MSVYEYVKLCAWAFSHIILYFVSVYVDFLSGVTIEFGMQEDYVYKKYVEPTVLVLIILVCFTDETGCISDG